MSASEEQIDELMGRTAARVAAQRRLPESTYRLQFHAGFTFRDAAAIVPYLVHLGITHVYGSPYMKARPGSTHGYDVIDHNALNPEIGTEADYAAFLDALAAHDMSHILDTVPNHVGVGTNDNVWWNDVLENGPASRYASYFDITWRGSPRPDLHDRVLLPLLGEPYAAALEKGQLQLAFHEGAFAVHYYDRRFPLSSRSYAKVLRPVVERSDQLNSTALAEMKAVVEACEHLPERCETGAAQIERRAAEVEKIKQWLARLVAEHPEAGEAIARRVDAYNGAPGDPASFDALDDLLSGQCFRLAYWKVAPDEINYRRFFDVNELAALSMEREEVFTATHQLTLRLLAEGKVSGLRIDHPDGLYDPRQYLRRLQEGYVLACARAEFQGPGSWEDVAPAILGEIRRAATASSAQAPPLYVVVEKILALGEPMPDGWEVHGTSGYDFLNMINALFVRGASERAFTRIYQDWTGDCTSFSERAYQNKKLILHIALASELQMLASRLSWLALRDRHSRDLTQSGLRDALCQVIACFPVYRSYISDDGVGTADRMQVERAITDARARNPATPPAVFEFIREMLLLRYPRQFGEREKIEQRSFVGKFQQLTAPVTAKGIEDTTFYVYNRLTSLNEVGGDPAKFGISPDELHAYLWDRQANFPYALSPLSTHDTKRSEDVRARVNVLSEMPDEWRERLRTWGTMNAPHRQKVGAAVAPHPNDEYLLYQTLNGAWPMEMNSGERGEFIKRIQAYMRKAFREAKVRTSWTDPNGEYEEAVDRFIARILDREHAGKFLDDFVPFQKRVSRCGSFNSLAQTVLRIAAPGVPDTYQGTELWDFSLVDPDNRRPVNYHLRRQMLEDLRARIESAGQNRAALAAELAAAPEDSRIKLYVTSLGLSARRSRPGLFSAGTYLPAEVVGSRADHVFGFARRQAASVAVAVISRFFTDLMAGGDDLPVGPQVWRDSVLHFHGLDPGRKLVNIYTGEHLMLEARDEGAAIPVADALNIFPVAIFVSE